MGRRDYAAAAINKLTANWGTTTTSADTELRKDIKKVRSRSRELERNNDYARRFGKALENNVLGSTGIGLQMKIQEPDGKNGFKYDTAANSKVENAWHRWGKKKNCTMSGLFSWSGSQRVSLRRAAFDGGFLIQTIKGKAAGNEFNFALNLIEIDHVDHDYDAKLANGNEIRMGIEFDPFGKEVAYHLLDTHPGEAMFGGRQRRRRVEASTSSGSIIHVFIPERIRQSHGVPWIQSAMTRLNMLGGYEEAEMVAARVGACKGGFFYSENGEQYEGEGKDAAGNTVSELEPGQFEQLPQGVKFEKYDPTHPNSQFGPFIKACLRGIASGIGMAYNSLANDLEGVNYSSIRAGLLEEREEWKMIQNWFIETVIEPIFEEWLEMAIISGQVDLPMAKFEKFHAAEWKPRRWPWVDPLKDITAKVLAIKNNLDSHRATISENGGDVEDVFTDRAADIALAEEKKLVLDPEGAAAAEKNKPPGKPAPGDEEEED